MKPDIQAGMETARPVKKNYGLRLPGIQEPPFLQIDSTLQSWIDALRDRISPERIAVDVRRMPAPRNRLHSPQAMSDAEALILEGWQAAGWAVERRPFRFSNVTAYQDYGETLADYMNPITHPLLEGANLVAVKEGTLSREAVLVIGHYDTVRDSPGANDNTASVAALLELARLLEPFRFRRSVILVATDMEELGLLGAKALAAELLRERPVTGVINYETMGYTDNATGSQHLPPGIELLFPGQITRIRERGNRADFTAVIYNQAASQLASAFSGGLAYLAGAHAPLSLRDPGDIPLVGKLLGRVTPAARNFARGDHVPFWKQGIPALFVNDTANFRYPYYHTMEDTPEKLDYQRLAQIVGATAVVLAIAAEYVE